MREGDRVRFSETGAARVRSMPEAWGLHRALLEGEVGEVTEAVPAEAGRPAQCCVEFPSGAAHYWEEECFVGVDRREER